MIKKDELVPIISHVNEPIISEKIIHMLDHLINEVLQELNPETPEREEQIRSFVLSAILYSSSNFSNKDMRLLENTMHEVRAALNLFRKHRDRRKISIFGSARTKLDDPLCIQTVELAKYAVKNGFMVITGGGPGIMHAGNLGAGARNSIGLGLKLPYENGNAVFDHYPDHLLNFRYFFTRKLMFFNESDAFVTLPGGYGTMDELYQGLTLIQTGKKKLMPIVLLDQPGGKFWKKWENTTIENLVKPGYINHYDLALHKIFYDAHDAVDYIRNFYKNFCSYTTDKKTNTVTIEFKICLTTEELLLINELLFRVKWHTSFTLHKEIDHGGFLTYLYLTHFSDRDHSKLKALIDLVNTFLSR